MLLRPRQKPFSEAKKVESDHPFRTHSMRGPETEKDERPESPEQHDVIFCGRSKPVEYT